MCVALKWSGTVTVASWLALPALKKNESQVGAGPLEREAAVGEGGLIRRRAHSGGDDRHAEQPRRPIVVDVLRRRRDAVLHDRVDGVGVGQRDQQALRQRL